MRRLAPRSRGAVVGDSIWTLAFTVMGIACVVNAVRCGRVHCYFTGPFLLLLAAASLLLRPPSRLARPERMAVVELGRHRRNRRVPDGARATLGTLCEQDRP